MNLANAVSSLFEQPGQKKDEMFLRGELTVTSDSIIIPKFQVVFVLVLFKAGYYVNNSYPFLK